VRTYESIVVFHPEATDEARREVQDKIQSVVEKFGGEIQSKDDWGKRKLAYAVKKHRYGVMNRIQLKADPKVVSDLDLVFRHAESVLRYATAVISERQLKQQKSAEVPAPAPLDATDNARRKK